MMMYRKFLFLSAFGLRMLATLLEHWYLLILILYFFVLPVTPHLSLGYDSSYDSCLYLGHRGLVAHDGFMGECPLLVLLNPLDTKRVYEW